MVNRLTGGARQLDAMPTLVLLVALFALLSPRVQCQDPIRPNGKPAGEACGIDLDCQRYCASGGQCADYVSFGESCGDQGRGPEACDPALRCNDSPACVPRIIIPPGGQCTTGKDPPFDVCEFCCKEGKCTADLNSCNTDTPTASPTAVVDPATPTDTPTMEPSAAPTTDGAAPTPTIVTPTADDLTSTPSATPTATPTADNTTPTASGMAPTADGVAPTADGATPTMDGAAPTGGAPTGGGGQPTASSVPTEPQPRDNVDDSPQTAAPGGSGTPTVSVGTAPTASSATTGGATSGDSAAGSTADADVEPPTEASTQGAPQGSAGRLAAAALLTWLPAAAAVAACQAAALG